MDSDIRTPKIEPSCPGKVVDLNTSALLLLMSKADKSTSPNAVPAAIKILLAESHFRWAE
jgi:hypothetical protein